MLTRQQVYELIDRERQHQDSTYDPNFILTSGLTRQQRDREVSPGILMLEGYARKATSAWIDTKNGNNLPALQEVAKIAAIAVRVLERSGGSEELLTKGLREIKPPSWALDGKE